MSRDDPPSPLKPWKMTINNRTVFLHPVNKLSLPSRGTVFLVKGNVHGNEEEPQILNYVLKEITINQKDEEEVNTRWETLKNLSHENVVRYYHHELSQTSLQVCVRVLMEWCRMGSLAEIFKDTSPDLCAMHKLTKDIVNGVDYIHSKGIFHGDIKPENIFVGLDANDDLVAKVGDLDDFVPVPEGMTNNTCLRPSDLVGTFIYLSPERRGVVKTEGIKRNADIWSMGCTFVYLATHRSLCFVNPKNGQTFNMTKNPNREHVIIQPPGQTYNPTPRDRMLRRQETAALLKEFITAGGQLEIPKNIPVLVDFIGRCLTKDPRQRPSAHELLNDPWMSCDPEVRFVDGINQRPFIIKLRSNNLLPRHTDSEKEHIDILWSNSANCGVRFLAHFQAPLFNITDADDLIHKCPKALDPGKPLQQKYCDILIALKEELGIPDETTLTFAIGRLSNQQMLADLTRGLQPVGAPFPELVDWLNTFETEYEYVVRENATWKDIQVELDAGRPVMVMTQSGRYRIRANAKLFLFGIRGIPNEVPALSVTIVHGFIGSTDSSRSLICTGSNGIMREWAYADFIKCWDWNLDDWRHHKISYDKIFECAQVRRRSMVYRCKKGPGSPAVGEGSASESDRLQETPAEAAGGPAEWEGENPNPKPRAHPKTVSIRTARSKNAKSASPASASPTEKFFIQSPKNFTRTIKHFPAESENSG